MTYGQMKARQVMGSCGTQMTEKLLVLLLDGAFLAGKLDAVTEIVEQRRAAIARDALR